MKVTRSAFAFGLLLAAVCLLMYGLVILRPAETPPNEPATRSEPAPAPPTAAPAAQSSPATRPRTVPPIAGMEKPPLNTPPELPAELRDGPPTPLPENLPDPAELREQFQLLMRFLELPPERLARIRETIERIEALPQDRKQMMIDRLRTVQLGNVPTASSGSPLDSLDRELRNRTQPLIDRLAPKDRATLLDRLSNLPAAQRAALLEGMLLQASFTEHGIVWPE